MAKVKITSLNGKEIKCEICGMWFISKCFFCVADRKWNKSHPNYQTRGQLK